MTISPQMNDFISSISICGRLTDLRSVHALVGMLTGPTRPGLKRVSAPHTGFFLPISMRKMTRNHGIFHVNDKPMRLLGSQF